MIFNVGCCVEVECNGTLESWKNRKCCGRKLERNKKKISLKKRIIQNEKKGKIGGTEDLLKVPIVFY